MQLDKFYQHMFDMIDYEYPSNFDASKYLVAFSFHDFFQFSKLQMPFEAMIEINIQTLQKTFNARGKNILG
jgi:hypothetical protein